MRDVESERIDTWKQGAGLERSAEEFVNLFRNKSGREALAYFNNLDEEEQRYIRDNYSIYLKGARLRGL